MPQSELFSNDFKYAVNAQLPDGSTWWREEPLTQEEKTTLVSAGFENAAENLLDWAHEIFYPTH